MYLFDIRPFTFLTLSGTPSPTLEANHSNGGVLVTGATSGAKGFVFADGTGGAKVILTNVIGTFSNGEKIKTSDSGETDDIVEDSGDGDLTISSIKTNSIEDVRQVFMDDNDSGEDFSCDVVLDNQNTDSSFLVIDGTDTSGSNADDVLRMEDGTTVVTSLGDTNSTSCATQPIWVWVSYPLASVKLKFLILIFLISFHWDLASTIFSLRDWSEIWL